MSPEQTAIRGPIKEGPKTMMLVAISAETFRMPNGNNHHLLKFALICSLPPRRSRVRRLVSILSCALHSGLSCVERTVLLSLPKHQAHILAATNAAASIEYSRARERLPYSGIRNFRPGVDSDRRKPRYSRTGSAGTYSYSYPDRYACLPR
jgi:hypothetical protein